MKICLSEEIEYWPYVEQLDMSNDLTFQSARLITTHQNITKSMRFTPRIPLTQENDIFKTECQTAALTLRVYKFVEYKILQFLS